MSFSRRATVRVISLLLFVGAGVACRGEIEVRGAYISFDSQGLFVPCDDSRALWYVSDAALASAWRSGGGKKPMLVRVRGTRADSGSVYGGRQYLEIHDVLEIRTRRGGECPTPADSMPVALRPVAANSQ